MCSFLWNKHLKVHFGNHTQIWSLQAFYCICVNCKGVLWGMVYGLSIDACAGQFDCSSNKPMRKICRKNDIVTMTKSKACRSCHCFSFWICECFGAKGGNRFSPYKTSYFSNWMCHVIHKYTNAIVKSTCRWNIWQYFAYSQLLAIKDFFAHYFFSIRSNVAVFMFFLIRIKPW